jgi:uncharacterized protein (DUF983 family)
MASMMREIAHPLLPSIGHGLKGCCPACGRGRLFWKYLKVENRCEACDLDLARYPADDGPAYMTILITGHLVVAPLLLFPIIWRANPIYSMPLILGSLAVFTLTLLPRIKGGWIGLMYALGVTDLDSALHTADAAE